MPFIALALPCVASLQKTDAAAPIEGVWVDPAGSILFAGNRRVDWNVEDRLYTSMISEVPDGSLLGTYIAGREVFVSLRQTRKASDATNWNDNSTTASIPHLGPNPRTFSANAGEVRIIPKAVGGGGLIATLQLGFATNVSRIASQTLYVRAMSMDALTMAGKFEDKDASIELDDAAGRTSTFMGHVTYLGKKFSISGRRIMGRAGFWIFDDSRFGTVGWGYATWTPSSSRASDIRSRTSDKTDQLDVMIKIGDETSPKGIHRFLRRSG